MGQPIIRKTKKNFEGFSSTAEKTLLDYYWPGNIRELENSIERACVLGRPPFIQAEDLRINLPVVKVQKTESSDTFENLADEIANPADGDRSLKTALNKFKTAYIMKILDSTSWNQTEAGKVLGIQRTYVSRLMNELHIR